MSQKIMSCRFTCGGVKVTVQAAEGSGVATVFFEGDRKLAVPTMNINVFRDFMDKITHSTEMLGWMSRLLPVLNDQYQDEGALSQAAGVPVGLVRPAAQELLNEGLAESQEMPNTFLWRRKQ